MSLVLKIRRGDTPFYRALRGIARWLFKANVPVPLWIRPLLRFAYHLHFLVVVSLRRAYILFYADPLFRARCKTVGEHLDLTNLPFIVGHTEIHLGHDVSFTGNVSIFSGRFCDHPRLVIGDCTGIGANTVIVVNREVVIEEHVRVGPNCRIQDSDGHPKDAVLRARNAPLSDSDIRPVRICRNAWIGDGSYVMKGVTIGEGTIIGANSVVVSNIPANCIAMGNPAEVYFRDTKNQRPNDSPA